MPDDFKRAWLAKGLLPPLQDVVFAGGVYAST